MNDALKQLLTRDTEIASKPSERSSLNKYVPSPREEPAFLKVLDYQRSDESKRKTVQMLHRIPENKRIDSMRSWNTQQNLLTTQVRP